MLRIGKLTDYGTVVMTALARDSRRVSASELATNLHLTVDVARKVLKLLNSASLVEATRGAQGGYQLARPASDISMAEIIEALEGPIALTECSIHDHRCSVEQSCNARGNWHLINRAIRLALAQVSLADMAAPGSGRIAALARRIAPPQAAGPAAQLVEWERADA